MTDYKLVPVEPTGLTDEQIFSIAEPFGAFEFGDAQGDKTLAFARAILAAAPVQGEPVAWLCEWESWQQYHDESDPMPEAWDNPPTKITPLYAAPQPAEQRPAPDASALVEALEVMLEMVELGGFGKAYAMDIARAALAAYHKGSES